LSVTAVQLAQAYTVLAACGVMRELSFVSEEARFTGSEKRIFSEATARQVIAMLDTVVQGDGGTGRRAQIDGYRVAGKTGTAHKVSASGGYDRNRYLTVFAGMVPSTDPRIVAVVVIDEPGRSQIYGGQVAAPLFAEVSRDALRMLNVRPDKLPGMQPWWEVEAEQKRLEAELLQQEAERERLKAERETMEAELRLQTTGRSLRPPTASQSADKPLADSSPAGAAPELPL